MLKYTKQPASAQRHCEVSFISWPYIDPTRADRDCPALWGLVSRPVLITLKLRAARIKQTPGAVPEQGRTDDNGPISHQWHRINYQVMVMASLSRLVGTRRESRIWSAFVAIVFFWVKCIRRTWTCLECTPQCIKLCKCSVAGLELTFLVLYYLGARCSVMYLSPIKFTRKERVQSNLL
jgi:hypothetical protein